MQKLLWILLLNVSVSYGQDIRLLSNLDSSFSTGNEYIKSLNDSIYFRSGLGDQVIDVTDIDQELLNAALHFTINRYRQSVRRTELVYSEHLEFLAYNCTNYYHSSKFKSSRASRARFERVLYQASIKMGLRLNLISASVAYVDVLNFTPGKRIYSSRNSAYPGFYYRSASGIDPATDDKVSVRTYNQLATEVLKEFTKGNNRSFLLSDSFEESACYLLIDQNSIRRKSPPKIKVIQVEAGKRLTISDD